MSRQLGRSDSRARNEPNTFVMEVENDQVEVNRNSSESESDSNSNRSNNIHTPVNHQMVPLETLRADADQRIAPLLEKMDNLTAEVQWLRRKCSSRERRRRASTERRHSRERSRKRRNRRHHEESSSSDSSSEEERYRRKGKRRHSISERSSSEEDNRRSNKRRRLETDSESEHEDKFVGEERTGKPIKREVKKHCDTYYAGQLQFEDLKRKLDRYPRPENLEKIKTPQTNQIIWEKLRATTRSTDIKVKRIQNNLAAATTAVARTLEKTDDKEMVKQLKDGLAIIGQAHVQLNQLRKHTQKKSLPYTWRQIKEVKSDEFDLYGPDDDLRKRIKDLEKDSNKRRQYFLETEKRYNQKDRRFHQNNQRRFQNKNQSQNNWKHQSQMRRSPMRGGFKKRGKIEVRVNELDVLKQKCLEESQLFKAGDIKNYISNWKQITYDKKVLALVLGVKIVETDDEIITQKVSSKKGYNFDKEERDKISIELEKMEQAGIITKTYRQEGEVISNIFTRLKGDGISLRLILNLKKLNKELSTEKFKMAGIMSALKLIKKGCFMASIDLIQAYYSVPIAENHKKFLKFMWEGTCYMFTCLPNGYCRAPFYFTKITKPIAAYLHNLGHMNCFYLDDTLIVSDTKAECIKNVLDTADIFQKLGFKIHPEKSVFLPSTRIEFLGFIIDSAQMTIELTEKRKNKILANCKKVVDEEKVTIRQLATLIGLMVSAMTVMVLGKLFYRELEKCKIQALKQFGNWEKKITITKEAIEEIVWWQKNIPNTVAPIKRGNPRLIIVADASRSGYGSICNGITYSGHWTKEETSLHINQLELLSALYSLKHFAKHFSGHCRLMLDNTTAIQNITNMGSCKNPILNDITKEMWLWANKRGIWLSAGYVPSAENIADGPSRKIINDSEYMLNKEIFSSAVRLLGFTPTIDLFASRANTQLPEFISFTPQPGAKFVDAFSISWAKLKFYAFPPFAFVLQTLEKILDDKATGIIVFPVWEAQPFWPVAMRMIQKSFILSARRNLLVHPINTETPHRMHKSLKLIIALVSGKDVRQRVCLPVHKKF